MSFSIKENDLAPVTVQENLTEPKSDSLVELNIPLEVQNPNCIVTANSSKSATHQDAQPSNPSQTLGVEAWDYLYDSLFAMIDPPIRNEDLMGVEEALLEIAMFEEIKMKQDEDTRRGNK